MNTRKKPTINEQYYHIFNRSIAKYQIFNSPEDYLRMLDIIGLFRFADFDQSYSNFARSSIGNQNSIKDNLYKTSSRLVDIIAYTLMPTHFHLILKQNIDNGISHFIARTLNSYTRYFNTRHQRKGPLWEGHFSSVLIEDDEQLLHTTRYVHLNATTARLVDKPENWQYSSYHEYINEDRLQNGICNFKDLIIMSPEDYKKFTDDQIKHQKDLSKIKHLLIDNYSE